MELDSRFVEICRDLSRYFCFVLLRASSLGIETTDPLVCATIVTVARSVKATTCMSTVLYRHPGHISHTPAQQPQLEISTRGVNMVANPRSGTCQKDLENSVNMLCSD